MHLDLRLFRSFCRLETDLPAVLRHCSFVFRPTRPQNEKEPAVRFSLFGTAGNEPYRLIRNGDVLGEFVSLPGAVLALDHALFSWAATSDPGMAVFHAAWAVLGRRAVLLPGEGGAGKTMLCLRLCSRGLAFGSDEAAAFVSRTGMLVPFSRKPMLKPGAFVTETAAAVSRTENLLHGLDGRHYTEPPGTPPRWAAPGPYRLLVVFPRYDPSGPPFMCAPLSTIEALSLLLAQSFRPAALTQPLFRRLVNALGPSTAFHLRYADPGRAERFVLDHLHGT